MKYINLIKGMTKFLLYPNISKSKLTNLPRYTKLYLHMQAQKQLQIQKDILTYKQSQIDKQKQNSIKQHLSQTKQQIKQRLTQFNKNKVGNMEELKNINFQETSKYYFKKGFQYLGLYYQSLQNLVEGKRQVLHNQKFKFQDGESVKEKQIKMQAKLRKLLGQKPKEDPLFDKESQQQQTSK